MQKLKIPAETIIRIIVLIVALINQALTVSGRNPLPFAENTVYELLTAFSTIAAGLWAAWKNNSFTQEALQGDKLMKKLKK